MYIINFDVYSRQWVISLFAMDSTDRLEIGRYEHASNESMSAFFKIGMMYADFILDGTTPCCRDQQNRWLWNGAMMSTFAFSSRIGSGSDEHCLSGCDVVWCVVSQALKTHAAHNRAVNCGA